jgi:catechol 2,3-dioxygenase-like lactoylglutathione lyase family enzyme
VIGDRPAAVSELDHVVIHTANCDRALAVYAAKLGLDLRLDRSNADWGVRQMFLKAGDGIVEFGASLKVPVSDQPDSFGGLAWRVPDADAAQARLRELGFDVSDVRTGRKPGTRVLTVRSGVPAGPALIIEQNALVAGA